jgi:hypothetical protein
MYKSAIGFVLITFLTLSALFSAEPYENHKPNPGKSGLGENHKWPRRANEPDKKLHHKCLYPTVKITNTDGDSGGSGVIVRSSKVGNEWHNILITASHAVECNACEPENLWVHVPVYEEWSTVKEYKKYRLGCYAHNKDLDISIGMFISDEKMPTAELCFDAKLYMNTEVFHVGYGLLDDARIDYGQITSPKATSPPFFKGFIRTNAYTFMGDSGGPLFLKGNYKLIGICHGIRTYRHMLLPNISYYSPITGLKTWDAEQNNAFESVYNEKVAMPVIPFVRLRTKTYEIEE